MDINATAMIINFEADYDENDEENNAENQHYDETK